AEDIGLTDRGVLPDTAAARFLDWLSRTDKRWLVVLDNVTDSGGLRGLWPAGVSGQTIVTRSEERRVGKEGRCGGSRCCFQAEDGIRDWSVTGVQTCALPICRRHRPHRSRRAP